MQYVYRDMELFKKVAGGVLYRLSRFVDSDGLTSQSTIGHIGTVRLNTTVYVGGSSPLADSYFIRSRQSTASVVRTRNHLRPLVTAYADALVGLAFF